MADYDSTIPPTRLQVTYDIVKSLTREIFVPKDVVYYEGQRAKTSCMYFVTHGRCVHSRPTTAQ